MIRRATLVDVPALAQVAERMHQESRFSNLHFSAWKMRRVVEGLIDHPRGLALIATRGDAVIGGFLAIIEEHIFGDDLFAFDLGTFILPQYRGGFTGPALLRAYVKWAQSMGVAKIQGGVASGIDPATTVGVFRAVGFAPVGLAFEYQGKP